MFTTGKINDGTLTLCAEISIVGYIIEHEAIEPEIPVNFCNDVCFIVSGIQYLLDITRDFSGIGISLTVSCLEVGI